MINHFLPYSKPRSEQKFTHYLLKTLLHSPIKNRTEHIRRSEMHLYRCLHHRKIHMMIPHHLIRTHSINILHDFPATTRKIDIDVPGSTHIRVRIKQRIPLPLQDAVSKVLVLEVLANLYGILKQFDILFSNLFRHCHPLHQQLLLWCKHLWQPPETIKQHTKQSLLLGDTIQLLPIHFLQKKYVYPSQSQCRIARNQRKSFVVST